MSEGQSATSLSGKRVVLCEDEAVEVMHLRYALRQAGLFVVGSAHTGEKAVQVVLHTRPELVLMDIKMPVMDGLDAAEQILSEYPVCMVILTAYDDKEYRARAKAIGVSSYLVKPIQAAALLRQLEEAFALYNATHEQTRPPHSPD